MSVLRRQEEIPEPDNSSLSEFITKKSNRYLRKEFVHPLNPAHERSKQPAIVSPLHQSAMQQFQLAKAKRGVPPKKRDLKNHFGKYRLTYIAKRHRQLRKSFTQLRMASLQSTVAKKAAIHQFILALLF